MSDKKSDLGITLVELIPSKDVCAYMEQQGRVLTDFEKAALIYNHSGMDYAELHGDEPEYKLLVCAQFLLQGHAGLGDFQVVCEEYCRKKKGEMKSC